MTTDRAFCRDLGHLPRRIEAHPTEPNKTLETCLRCWTRIERSRSLGMEIELPRGGRLQFLGIGEQVR